MDALAKELQEVQEKYSVALQHYQLTLQVNSEALQVGPFKHYVPYSLSPFLTRNWI